MTDTSAVAILCRRKGPSVAFFSRLEGENPQYDVSQDGPLKPRAGARSILL